LYFLQYTTEILKGKSDIPLQCAYGEVSNYNLDSLLRLGVASDLIEFSPVRNVAWTCSPSAVGVDPGLCGPQEK
jgi:hypothetical protein